MIDTIGTDPDGFVFHLKDVKDRIAIATAITVFHCFISPPYDMNSQGRRRLTLSSGAINL